MSKRIFFPLFLFLFPAIQILKASELLIPMDLSQGNHLKAYGIAYWVLKQGGKIDWLLNYRGGSFGIPYAQSLENECKLRGVGYEIIADGQYTAILTEIAD